MQAKLKTRMSALGHLRSSTDQAKIVCYQLENRRNQCRSGHSSFEVWSTSHALSSCRASAVYREHGTRDELRRRVGKIEDAVSNLLRLGDPLHRRKIN